MQQVTKPGQRPFVFHANRTIHDKDMSFPACQCGWYMTPVDTPAEARTLWAEHATGNPQGVTPQASPMVASSASHASPIRRGRGGRRTLAVLLAVAAAVFLTGATSSRQIAGSATVVAQADRLEKDHPKPPYLTLTGCDLMEWHFDQAGLPDEFDWIGFGESSCRNDVHTWCCWGYAQIHEIHIGQPHTEHCDVDEIADMFGDNPTARSKNACMAKAVYDLQGPCAWDVYHNRTGRCR